MSERKPMTPVRALAEAMTGSVNGWQWFPEDDAAVLGVLAGLNARGYGIAKLMSTAEAARQRDEQLRRDAIKAATRPHCRLIRTSEDLFEFTPLGTRTFDGRALSAQWGEPDEFGIYEPTFTTIDDGWVEQLVAAERERLRRLVDKQPLYDENARTMADAADSMRRRVLALLASPVAKETEQ